MTPQLQSVKYLKGYRLHLTFSDGNEGDLDLAGELWGEVFEPLKDLKLFRKFRLNEELNTISWPTGADLAPEFLYEKIAAQHAYAPAETRDRGDVVRGKGSRRASRK